MLLRLILAVLTIATFSPAHGFQPRELSSLESLPRTKPKMVRKAHLRPPASHPLLDPSKTWMRTMESSLTPDEMGGPAVTSALTLLRDWLGWFVAFVSMVALAVMQLRSRRYSRLLLKGGERDFFLLPPAGNRRRRPR